MNFTLFVCVCVSVSLSVSLSLSVPLCLCLANALKPTKALVSAYMDVSDTLNPKPFRYYTANQRRATIVSDRAIWGGGGVFIV